MKQKIFMFASVLLFIVGISLSILAFYNDDRPIASSDLPESIQHFIKQNFPNQEIISSEIDFLEYKVWLDDHTAVEFDWDRDWEKIKSQTSAVPSDLVHPAILTYLNQINPEVVITKISKESFGYEVEILGSPIEYRFNSDGLFIGIDD